MNRFFKIGKAAELLGVSIQTLRRWEKQGNLLPDRKSKGTLYYSVDKLFGLQNSSSDLKIAYARVSSHDQKDDLKRQSSLLASFCISRGWNYEAIEDLGCGMNYSNKGLKRLLELILEKKLDDLL
jgi:putative resolvase